MNQYVFVMMCHDYADEFNVDCCFVESRKQFDEDMAKIKEGFNTLAGREFYFGTNEYLMFDSFESFESGVIVQECTESFYTQFMALCAGAVGFNVMERMMDNLGGYCD